VDTIGSDALLAPAGCLRSLPGVREHLIRAIRSISRFRDPLESEKDVGATQMEKPISILAIPGSLRRGSYDRGALRGERD
jgi:hypothetical protein